MLKSAGLLAALLLLCTCTTAPAFERSFWVWQRSQPLTDAERAELSAQGVQTLYWHVGELTNSGEMWRWKGQFTAPQSAPELRIVPVVRLTSMEKFPFSPRSLQTLLDALSLVTKSAKAVDELQLDFDCPDRLLRDYAKALKKIHAVVPKLSITALPGWSRLAALQDLKSSVDELLPMFYDFETDPLIQSGASPVPLIEPQKIHAWLAAWRDACKTTVWRAGLPAFARITVYDANGKSRGHLRDLWLWDEVCFNPALATIHPTRLGVTVFRAGKITGIEHTPIHTDELVVARWPDRVALRDAVTAAQTAGARGVAFFRLPDASAPSGWSLRQLGNLDAGVPRLVLRKADAAQQLALSNEADADLEPRLSGSGEFDRGYALELDAPAPVFREALEGDFARVTAQADADEKPRAAAIPLATRLTFWFSHLQARESLHTGLIQLAPGAALGQIRYRIRNAPENSEWKTIEE